MLYQRLEHLVNCILELDSLIQTSRIQYHYPDVNIRLLNFAFICRFEGISVETDACCLTGRFSTYSSGIDDFKENYRFSDRIEIVINEIAETVRSLAVAVGGGNYLPPILASYYGFAKYASFNNEIICFDSPDGTQIYIYLTPTRIS